MARKPWLPAGRYLGRPKQLLVVLALLVALIPVGALVSSFSMSRLASIKSWVKSQLTLAPQKAEAAKQPSYGGFETASHLLPSAQSSNGDWLTVQAPSGEKLQYTISSHLQQRVHDLMAVNKVPYGVFVAIEPATGRILAMTSYSSVDPRWESTAMYGLYPMASLFKIVTAAAALEQKRITPDTIMEFRGNTCSENPRYWSARPKGKNNRIDVTHAMGKSINPVYGLIANDIAGKASVMEQVQRFGFNQTLLPGIPVKASRAAEPQSAHGLKLMGAGLDHDVRISPLHAAAVMAAIANKGAMMSPALTEKVLDGANNEKEHFSPRELRRLVSVDTASSLTRMLSTSVTSGTSRKAFYDARGRAILAEMDIAAKTGSINGDDPKGHYSWFAAYAPADKPRIALVSLIINQDKWKIKSSQVGKQALDEFFKKGPQR